MQVEDTEKTVMRSGTETESLTVREIAWCTQSLSVHLERWCFGQKRDLKLHCLGMNGAADWMKAESHLEIEGGK